MSSLAGLVANYGDSDEEREDYRPVPPRSAPGAGASVATAPEGYENAAIHPPPIPHCPWSACYDESSGFTYYWNQQTNAVTWEALRSSAEVSAEEWQLYQQALAEKQTAQPKPSSKSVPSKSGKKTDSREKRIELITSYHNSDSESNDETESPKKSSSKPPPPLPVASPAPKPVATVPKSVKKLKKAPPVEYGPPLPPNQNYTVPIGPELPPQLVATVAEAPKSPDVPPPPTIAKDEEKKSPKANDAEDSEDESLLLMKLKDKAKLLEKLGGEIPSELKEMIKDAPKVKTPPVEVKKGADIDDLLAEIEQKELPKVKAKKIDIFDDGSNDSAKVSKDTSTPPRCSETPPLEELKTLFPSAKAIANETDEKPASLFPSAANIVPDTQEIQENGVDKPSNKTDTPPLPPEKKTNIYLSDSNAPSTSRKKFRISNSVLPERPKPEPVSYTTKYSSHIEGFSSERTGLGFSNDETETPKDKETVSYGNGLLFTKGEVLNEDKKDEELDDMVDLVEAKLKFLNQVQPSMVTPVQEMLIQMQTLVVAWRAGALTPRYWRRWVKTASQSIQQQEAAAAPPGWHCSFQRSAGRYQYIRQSDGFAQWDYPMPVADMDISTTPPHPGIEQPVLAAAPLTPPPPAWHDPPPPGIEEATAPLPSEPPKPKQEIGDELASFYSDLAELEKQTPSQPTTATNSPEHKPPPPPSITEEVKTDKKKDKEEKPRKKTKKAASHDKSKYSLNNIRIASFSNYKRLELTRRKIKKKNRGKRPNKYIKIASFYNDLAELEKQTPSQPTTATNSPEHKPPPPPSIIEEIRTDKKKDKEEKPRKKTKPTTATNSPEHKPPPPPSIAEEVKTDKKKDNKEEKPRKKTKKYSSFYNDLAELEKQTPSQPTTATNSPEHKPPPPPSIAEEVKTDKKKDKEEKPRKKTKPTTATNSPEHKPPPPPSIAEEVKTDKKKDKEEKPRKKTKYLSMNIRMASFYNDLAELEKQTPSQPTTATNSPEHKPPPPPSITEEVKTDKKKEKEENLGKDQTSHENSKYSLKNIRIASFYKDLAELEKQTPSQPTTATNSPEHKPPPPPSIAEEVRTDKKKDKEEKPRKKTKPTTATNSPEHKPPPPPSIAEEVKTDKKKDKEEKPRKKTKPTTATNSPEHKPPPPPSITETDKKKEKEEKPRKKTKAKLKLDWAGHVCCMPNELWAPTTPNWKKEPTGVVAGSPDAERYGVMLF
ncbi:formin-binding protein 4-like [Phthorimaea operculella]|nr:formin-binding protein 4-like [Phthorimaea operculella]